MVQGAPFKLLESLTENSKLGGKYRKTNYWSKVEWRYRKSNVVKVYYMSLTHNLWQSFWWISLRFTLNRVFFFMESKKINTEIRKSNVGLDRMKIRERDAESGTNLDPSSKSISSCWQFFPQMPFWSTTPQYSKLS